MKRLVSTLAIICLYLNTIPVFALKLPQSVKTAIKEVLSVERIRLDGAVETKAKELYLPLLPSSEQGRELKTAVRAFFPARDVPDFILFDNGWCYLKVLSRGNEKTVIPLADLPEELRQPLLSTRFPSDLIVPEHFYLPPSLKSVAASVAITIKQIPNHHNDKQKNSAEHNEHLKGNEQNEENISKEPCILITSPTTGKVSLLSFPELNKIIEFPTEGTPSGVAYAAGKVYIADQTKSRILKLDPYHKVFLGQIDLPKHCVPKDVIALSSGKLIYVSEDLFNDIAVIEPASDKVLLRTKVNSYPGRMAITPDEHLLLIISVPDGKVSFVSTQDQRYLGVVKVGSLPSGISISADNQIAYISNRVSNTISVIDLVHKTIINTFNTGAGPTGVAVDSKKGYLYVANAKDNSIGVHNLKNGAKINEIKLPIELDFPGSIALLPDQKHLIVSSESTDSVGLLNTESNVFEKIVVVGHNSELCLWIPAHE